MISCPRSGPHGHVPCQTSPSRGKNRKPLEALTVPMASGGKRLEMHGAAPNTKNFHPEMSRAGRVSKPALSRQVTQNGSSDNHPLCTRTHFRARLHDTWAWVIIQQNLFTNMPRSLTLKMPTSRPLETANICCAFTILKCIAWSRPRSDWVHWREGSPTTFFPQGCW